MQWRIQDFPEGVPTPGGASLLLPPANEVWGKVIFLHLSVILFIGGGIPACLAGLQGGLQAHTQGGGWGVWPGRSLQAHTQVGVSRPTPGGSSPTPGGSPGPHLEGGLQAHTQGEGGGVFQHALRQNPPADGYCYGRYAPSWNAFLLPATTKLGQGNAFTGVCDSVHRGALPQCMLDTPQTRHPPAQTPPRPDPPLEQTPPGGDPLPNPPDQTPPGEQTPSGSRRQHTVNERPVRILLECILVWYNFCRKLHEKEKKLTKKGARIPRGS